MRNVSQWLKSDKVLLRLAALWLICALLFTAAWTTSYYLLPEGILRGKLAGQYIPVETPHVITTFLRILGVNLLAGCGLVTLANLCRVGDMSLGYQIVTFHAVLYGILLGTNSFGIPAPARFAPSLTTVLNRSGAFEITAYIAIAAATRGLTIWRQRSWLDWQSEQVGSWRAWQLNRAEIAVIVGAVLLLASANYREAVQMHQYFVLVQKQFWSLAAILRLICAPKCEALSWAVSTGLLMDKCFVYPLSRMCFPVTL